MATPKLRFKEFDGEWLSAPLKKYFPKIRNGFVGVATPYYVDKGVKYLQGKNVKDGKIDPAGLIYISEEFHLKKNNSKLSIDDILMVQSGHVGECAVIETEYDNANCHALIVLSPHQEQKTNSHFVKYYFYTPLGKKIISQVKTGNTIEHVLASEIKEVELNFPSKAEQTKIASFLSAVDEKISQLTQKHELLSQYKQGMMQKLFSQKIRFKADDGSEFGEWEKLTLSQISKHIGGTALESYVSECGDYNFISIGNYSTNGKYIDNSQRIILNEKTGTKLLDKDDLVMVLNDKTATGDLIGSTILINEDNKYIYNQRSERIICNKSKVLSVYLWHFLNSEMMRSEVRKLAQGGTQIYINFSSVLSIIFLLPCLAEQNKIANFLSSIDQKIEVVAQQIEHAKQWKKGLLQQMFV